MIISDTTHCFTLTHETPDFHLVDRADRCNRDAHGNFWWMAPGTNGIIQLYDPATETNRFYRLKVEVE